MIKIKKPYRRGKRSTDTKAKSKRNEDAAEAGVDNADDAKKYEEKASEGAADTATTTERGEAPPSVRLLLFLYLVN